MHFSQWLLILLALLVALMIFAMNFLKPRPARHPFPDKVSPYGRAAPRGKFRVINIDRLDGGHGVVEDFDTVPLAEACVTKFWATHPDRVGSDTMAICDDRGLIIKSSIEP